MDTNSLTGRQRRELKGRAQQLEPAVFVGDAGITDGVLHALEEALRSRELVKVRMRQPSDKKAMATELGAATGATLLGLIGHTVLLYRAKPDDSPIEPPA
jgi:RNA-binding protein